MTTVYEHLERFAGEIVGGWPHDPDGKKLPFQVVQTAGGPHLGTTTFSTLGLGKIPLSDGKAEPRMIRHELVMIVPADAVPANIVGILQQAGMEAISRNTAYLRGEMLGPRGPLFEGFEPKALYACIPVYFPDEFSSAITEEAGEVVFVWLVPLLDSEAHYLHVNGWRAFEQKLIAEDPDLTDYRRTAPAL
ncbi:suppressor of fused domain protein [Luteibacter sp. PPL201]|uniref:Suppressor of fused domain protein n=1 Tax=Luteibacter sahnii TaxID=3021977 RepID=A0ABT6B949_9GAMM